MNRQPIAYFLFGAGAAIAVSMEMLRIPALTFALGMYLPLELNSPALVGGYLHLVADEAAQRITRARVGEGNARDHRPGEAAQNRAVEVQLHVVPHEADPAELLAGQVGQLEWIHHCTWAHQSLLEMVWPVRGLTF